MQHNKPTITPSSVIDELAAQINAEQADAELRLIEAVFAEGRVAETVPLAQAAGVSKSWFSDDRQVLWLVAEVVAPRSVSATGMHSFSRAALKLYGHWDETQIVGNYGASRWSDATLDAMTGAMFFSPTAIKQRAGLLASIRRRERDAREHIQFAQRILSGEAA